MYQTLRRSPFLRLTLFFVAGITVQYYKDIASISLYGVLLSCLLLLISLIPGINHQYSFRWLFGGSILFLSFFGAAFLTRYAFLQSDWNQIPGEHTYQVRITDEPSRKPRSRMCKACILATDDDSCLEVIDKNIILYLAQDSLADQLVAGDCIRLRARLDKPRQLSGDIPFDYPAFLRKQGVAATGYVPQRYWQKDTVAVSGWDELRFLALSCQRFLLVRLQRMIPEEKNCQVAAAMLLGYRNDMDNDLLMSFSATGASHVLSVSGMHTAILYGVLYFLLSFWGQGTHVRIFRQLVIVLFMWWFAFLTGLSPSVVRATLMISVVGIGEALSRRPLTFNTVGASAFFMLLYNPLSLFDVGFQLSFMAVLGIIIINPLLVNLYSIRQRIVKYCWDLCCVSTSAQIGTLPVSIYYFHQFPLTFLITNLFVIPLVGILMILIPVSLLAFSVFPSVSILFLPVNRMLLFFISGVEVLQRMPYGTLTGLEMGIGDACLMYVFFLVVAQLFMKKRVVYLYLLLLLVLFRVFYYLCSV